MSAEEAGDRRVVGDEVAGDRRGRRRPGDSGARSFSRSAGRSRRRKGAGRPSFAAHRRRGRGRRRGRRRRRQTGPCPLRRRSRTTPGRLRGASRGCRVRAGTPAHRGLSMKLCAMPECSSTGRTERVCATASDAERGSMRLPAVILSRWSSGHPGHRLDPPLGLRAIYVRWVRMKKSSPGSGCHLSGVEALGSLFALLAKLLQQPFKVLRMEGAIRAGIRDNPSQSLRVSTDDDWISPL